MIVSEQGDIAPLGWGRQTGYIHVDLKLEVHKHQRSQRNHIYIGLAVRRQPSQRVGVTASCRIKEEPDLEGKKLRINKPPYLMGLIHFKDTLRLRISYLCSDMKRVLTYCPVLLGSVGVVFIWKFVIFSQ